MLNISLQALRVFESAARLGSFKEAANELALTPTAVSHHVKNLESRLGVELFKRQIRGVSLTLEGEKLARATTQGFDIIQQSVQELAMEASIVRVQATSSFAALVLIPALSTFNEKYPGIRVEVSTGETISRHSQSLAIRYGTAANVEPTDRLATESFNLYGTPELLKCLDQQCITQQEAMTIYTTAWKNNALPEVPWQEWLASNQLHESKFSLSRFDQEMYGIQQALAGKGLVFCSDGLIKSWLDVGLLKPLGTSAIPSSFCYYIKNKASLYGNTKLFVNWLSEAVIGQLK